MAAAATKQQAANSVGGNRSSRQLQNRQLALTSRSSDGFGVDDGKQQQRALFC